MWTVPSGGGSQDNSADQKEKIVCTEMYRQTQLDDWQRTIKLWYLFQKKYLSETHQKGYHFLFKPFVKGMQKSNILTSVGRHFAQERTKDIKHIMYGTKFSGFPRVSSFNRYELSILIGLKYLRDITDSSGFFTTFISDTISGSNGISSLPTT